MKWLFIFVPLGMFLLWMVRRGNKYRQIFASEHLVELARLLQGVKTAACNASPDQPPPDSPMDDDRCFVSSAGIACLYSVDAGEGVFLHHFSISMPGSYTPHAVGRPFSLYFAGLIGAPIEKLQLAVSESMVFHTAFEVSSEEHPAICEREIDIPTPAEATEKQRWCSNNTERFQWQRISAG